MIMKKQYYLSNIKTVAFLSILLINLSVKAHIDTVLVGPNNSTSFSPANFTMNMGDTVRWIWESGSHTTTSTNIPTSALSWNSSMNSSVQSFTYVPSEIGTYNYVCTPHSSVMKASFTVICNIDTSVYSSNDTLISNASNVNYQWVDCNNNYIGLAKDSNKLFIPTINGTYAVIITQNACIDTSLCYNVTNVDVKENVSMFSLEIYPNPSNGVFRINNSEKFNDANIIVFNSIGKKVHEINSFNENAVRIDISDHSKGIYFLEITEGKRKLSSKLILR